MKKIFLILTLSISINYFYCQTDSFFIKPAFKLITEKGKLRTISSSNNYAEYKNGTISIGISCGEGLQNYHNPEKTIKDFIFTLKEKFIKYKQIIQKNTSVFSYSKEEYDGQYFVNHAFLFNDYFMVEIIVNGNINEKNKIQKISKELLLHSYLMLPSELDKIEGYPINIAKRDSFINLTIFNIKNKIWKLYGITNFKNDEDKKITEGATELIDNQIKYNYSNQKYLDIEKNIIKGNFPINDWFDFIFLHKENEALKFYNLFNFVDHGETSDGSKIATSNYFKQLFTNDTCAKLECLHEYTPSIREKDTLFWAYTIIYDEKSMSKFISNEIENDEKIIGSDTIDAIILDIIKRDVRSNPNLETKDTLVIICFNRNSNGIWNLTHTKYGTKAIPDDFYFKKNYNITDNNTEEKTKEKDVVGDFVTLSNRNETQILIGNNKVKETNFIPITIDLKKYYKNYDVIITSFTNVDYINYSSSSSTLSDSIACTVFISPKIESLFKYDSIIKRKDINQFVNTASYPRYIIMNQNGVDDTVKSEERNHELLIYDFTNEYIKAIKPLKRIYVSKLFFNEDVDNDGKFETFRVIYSNGELIELIALQNTKTGITKVTNPLLINKILEKKEIKLMHRLSKMPENILYSK